LHQSHVVLGAPSPVGHLDLRTGPRERGPETIICNKEAVPDWNNPKPDTCTVSGTFTESMSGPSTTNLAPMSRAPGGAIS